MAQVTLQNPFDAFHGALTPKGLVNRRKSYRLSNGKVVAEGVQEAYAVSNPRDYKNNPPKGAELRNINLWTEASNRAAQLIALEKNDGILPKQTLDVYALRKVPVYYTWEEAQPLLRVYHERFDRQFPGLRGSCPDPDAKIDKTTNLPKRYIHFPSFLRTILYHDLKQNNNQ